MRRGEFWREWAQADLFPNRSTIGTEFSAVMLVKHKVSGNSTEAMRRPNSTKKGKPQQLQFVNMPRHQIARMTVARAAAKGAAQLLAKTVYKQAAQCG